MYFQEVAPLSVFGRVRRLRIVLHAIDTETKNGSKDEGRDW